MTKRDVGERTLRGLNVGRITFGVALIAVALVAFHLLLAFAGSNLMEVATRPIEALLLLGTLGILSGVYWWASSD